MRRVISLFLPRFAIERIDGAEPPRPPRPFSLVWEAGGRRVLYAVDRVAERMGLRPGMALADAQAAVPSLCTLPARPREDKRSLAMLADWCGRYSPWTAPEPAAAETSGAGDPAALTLEQGGSAGLWLDTTGCAHLFGGEDAMLDDMVGRLDRRGLTARAAIADTPGCAWALARFAPSPARRIVVPPHGTHDALAPLPVAALRLPSADVAGLHALGLRTIGDLCDLPRAPLAARFGVGVARRLDAALGAVPEPISPARSAPPQRVRHTFAEPIGRIEDITAAVTLLCAELCTDLDQTGLGARRLGLVLYRSDGTLARLAVGTARARRDPAHLARLFVPHVERVDPGFGIEDMMLVAEAVEPLGAAQLALARPAGDAGRSTAGVDALIDRLGNRLGAASVLRPATRESHLPERAAMLVSAFGSAAEPGPVASALCPRPPRLLRPPEPVEAVAETALDRIGGPPVLFRWRRAVHRIVHAEGPERIASEWWHGADDRNATRDYYRVEDAEGQRFWLYREESREAGGPTWYLHGVFG